MQVSVYSAERIGTKSLPGPSAVIRMADSLGQLAAIMDTNNVVTCLDLIFNDTDDETQGVRPPNDEDARRILNFISENQYLPNIVFQCEAGIGRSQAAAAALLKICGTDSTFIRSNGTYNRRLYVAMLRVAGIEPDIEPLVSLAVRVKYSPDRLKLFILSMQRQRHKNWELIAVTDGPNPSAAKLVANIGDPRIRVIETEKMLGRWGHPYRQVGIDACRGEFIGLSNDDNYYVPGYIEQMLFALDAADIAMCQTVHSHMAWRISPPADVGCWIARATLVRQVPWSGDDFFSDSEYLRALTAKAGNREVAGQIRTGR
jgi:hypothetical protein